jgi:hypothetical protein
MHDTSGSTFQFNMVTAAWRQLQVSGDDKKGDKLWGLSPWIS